MSQIQVKKVVAVCFLEAVKLTLEHLGAHRLELSEKGTLAPADLTRIYGDVRRLRDYLQRCVGGYGDQVDLDIAPGDIAVLVACCRRSVDALELRLAEANLPPDEREWLGKKQQVLGHWALELADKPLIELPLRRLTKTPGEVARMLDLHINQKIFGARQQTRLDVPASSNSMMLGLPSFGDQVHDMAPPSSESQYDFGFGPSQAAPAPQAPPPPAAAPRGPMPAAAAAAVPPLFDHQKICEPRLRALVGVDVRSYARAVAANDYRLATVMMASVLEAAVLDHVMARRADFGVTGTPEAWNVQELLSTALGDQAAPKDRSLAFHLFSSRNLLRPAVQVVTPTVVTVGSFEILRDFVQRALHGLGYGAPADTVPPGRFTAGDFKPNGGPGV